MDKPYASTTKENTKILNQDIKEDKYGLVGEVIFKMKHNQKVFRVSSIHLDQNRLRKVVWNKKKWELIEIFLLHSNYPHFKHKPINQYNKKALLYK